MIDHNKALSVCEMDPEDEVDVPKVSKKQKSQFIDEIVNEYTPNKKQKLDKHLYKAPTAEELNQLRETENLFHSNLFRLQIEEVLKAVKIKDKYKKLFNSWFESFKDQVDSIKLAKEIKIEDDLLSKKSGIKIPMENVANDGLETFTFSPPTNITIGGSYSLDTLVGPNASVDIFVEMPKSIFQRVDNRNYGYMRKKAIYLSIIASNINEELADSKSFIGSYLNPILKIVPKGKFNKFLTIYVHVVVEYNTFPLNRYTPERNNIRPNWYFKNSNKTYENNPPTPLYNHTVMHDLTTLKSNSENVKNVKEFPNIRDGIVLLKIWLKQRNLCNNFESINGHFITMYVLYLLHKKILNKFMSSYQILRNTWTQLAKSNWCKDGISFCQDDKINERIILYKKYHDCVFLDNTGFCNITPNISEGVAQWISNQAEMAINCLNNTKMNDFQILFMRKVPFYLSFDHIICLHNVKALQNVVNAKTSDEDKLNYGSNKYMLATKFITSTLKEGLKNRISIMFVMPRKMKEWNLNENIPEDHEKIYIGIELNPEFAFSIIEKGPEANLAEAQNFRKYWGEKSNLRRFRDSTVCEAVVWLEEGATLAQRRTVPRVIIKYLLENKLKLFEKSHYLITSNETDQLLAPKKLKVPHVLYGTEEVALKVIQAFDSLKAVLSSEEFSGELPLSIHGVQGCSPVFRYTEVFPPQALNRHANEESIVRGESYQLFADGMAVEKVPPYLGLIEATMQLSMSGKWPDELEALRMTKAAFYIQIADCLRKKYKLLACGSMQHIDIMKDGLVFRLKIAHEREIGLVKQIVDEFGVLKYRDNEESIELEKNLFQLPKLAGALHGVYCQQPSFGPACCLIKRWLSAQLIDESHMPGVVVELLVASMYLNPDPYRPTQVPQVAFMRFLESFSHAHWTTDPIIVNFNNEMTREEVIEIENQFGENRDSLPPLFISSPYDKSSNWTKKAPNSLILNRITDLAKESLKIIEEQIFEDVSLYCESLFIPPLSEYDCLIRLKSSVCARRFEAVNIDEDMPTMVLHPYKEHKNNRIPIVNFDPVNEYLKELRSAYDNFALFFHDTYGGTVIGVLLRPSALTKKDFKVKNVSCQKLSDNKLILNVSAMLEDFYILGKGLVENIDVQSKNIESL